MADGMRGSLGLLWRDHIVLAADGQFDQALKGYVRC